MLVNTPISVGELLDKITILQIKNERITSTDKLQHVRCELQALSAVALNFVTHSKDLDQLQQKLKQVNEILWDIEDSIRICEKKSDFSDKFVQLARQVYHQNDLRARIKLEINRLTGSELLEVKSYEDYA